MTKDFDVRSELMSLIAKTNDDHGRMVWMMLLGVQEQSAASINELAKSMQNGFTNLDKKMDTLLADEQTLRKSVLNGHANNHHEDHDWIQARRKADCDGICEWAKAKMDEEKGAAVAKKGVIRKVLEGMASQLGTILVTVIVTAVGLMQWIK